MEIDDAFVKKWHPKYSEHDEKEYDKIISAVSKDLTRIGTISKPTFYRIVNWKAARAKGYVEWESYGKYRKAFKDSLRAPEDQKVAMLDDLPGIGIPIASTVLHFIYSKTFPIVDFRTVEALQRLGYLDNAKSIHHFRDTVHGYILFRKTALKIAKSGPKRSLREIDRALFAYHKIRFGPKNKRR